MSSRTFAKDKRLLGTWQSDRGRTLAEWRFGKRLTPQKRQKFLAIFGKLRITYTPTRIHGSYGDYQFTQRYEVLAMDSDSVAIRYEDTQVTGQWHILHVHFEGQNRYWIALRRNRECFRRVKDGHAGREMTAPR
jgi:hypothetical protein